MRKAVIVGHTGQDGYYLSSLLHKKKYEVIGISSKQVSANTCKIAKVDILLMQDVEYLLRQFQPDEIYFLAAVHQSSADKQVDDGKLFQRSIDINIKALIHFLESIRLVSPVSKLFYAGSSHIFGSPAKVPQDESTPFYPNCIYGITKTAGIGACRFYRETHNIFASVGICYNHESPLRESKYVSMKIVEAAVGIKKGFKNELILGDLDAQIDWGYAPDYMDAVHAIMHLPESDDFILSSGAIHTVKEFVTGVFTYLELDWSEFVKVTPGLITKKQKNNLIGNNQKIKTATGWSPRVDFNGLIKILVDEEIKKHASK